MAALADYLVPPVAFSLLFNFLLGIVLLRLRSAAERMHLTLSQRWGLTLLGWLFIINTFQIVAHIGWRLYPLDANYPIHRFFMGLELNLVMLSYFPLLTFGLIYPRPVMKWPRLKVVIMLLAIFFVAMVPFQALVHGVHEYAFLDVTNPLIEILYLVVTFIPIFLWLPEYDKQNSPHMRMILTLLIWGYLFVHVSYDGGIALWAMKNHFPRNYSLIILVLVIVVFMLLGRSMFYRLGRWSTAEWTNLVLMVVSMGFALVGLRLLDMAQFEGIFLMTDPILGFLEFQTNMGGWMIVRPILFFYALVRFQVFGPELKASQSFTMLMAILGAGAVFELAFIGLLGFSIGGAMVIGLVTAVILFIPIRNLSKGVINRLLPMSGGAEKAPLAERRITYLMGLQTAVIGSELDSPYDKKALVKLRKALKVSEREHELLMAGFAREKPLEMEEKVEEVYLFHMDGHLLGFITRRKDVGAEQKKDMIATMFTAVGEFSKDALRAGGHMDALEYGDSTLIIEVEGSMALGVMLRGKDNPQVRQRMRDLLGEVQEKYSRVLKAMDGREGPLDIDIDDSFKGVEKPLKKFLEV
jgi:hypothetical protein